MRLRPSLACLLALLLAAPALPAAAADPPPTAYRLEPRKVPDLPEGKAAMVRGQAGEKPHRFFLEHLHMMVPVVVTLRPLTRDARLDLAIGKYPWEPPVRQGRAEQGQQVSFRFRTEGEFQVAVSSPDPGTPYKLLVWVGDEIKPDLKPVVVPASQYQGDAGGGNALWWGLAAAGLLVLAGGWVVFQRRRKRA